MTRQLDAKVYKIALFGHGIFATPSFRYIRGSSNFKIVNSLECADIALVANYGRIIKKSELAIPQFGFINLHGSLLPKFRGASPVQCALLGNLKRTGVTLIKMDDKVDHGAIISQRSVQIKPDENYGDLLARLGMLGGELVKNTLKSYLRGEIKPYPQDHAQASFSPKIEKKMTEIKPTDSPMQALAKTRAFSPKPRAFVVLSNNKKLFVLSARVKEERFLPERVQLEGKREMSYSDFIRGWRRSLPDIIRQK